MYDVIPFNILEMEILIHTPFTPNLPTNIKAIGTLSAVNTILIIDGILGNPRPVNVPLDIVSIVLNICEKATILK